MLPRTRFVTVTAIAMTMLLKNSWGMPGWSEPKPRSQPARVNGSGMIVRRAASGSVLNDVMICQAKGTSISSA